MEMHFKKTHSDIFECVLCESVLKDEESLELHTFTCEAYRCNECELNVKTLNMLKKHIINKHDGQCVHIYHVKQDRKKRRSLLIHTIIVRIVSWFDYLNFKNDWTHKFRMKYCQNNLIPWSPGKTDICVYWVVQVAVL